MLWPQFAMQVLTGGYEPQFEERCSWWLPIGPTVNIGLSVSPFSQYFDLSQTDRQTGGRNFLKPEKTEFLWSAYRYSLRKLGGCGPAIKLSTDTVKASGHVRLFGVIMSSDLSLEKHVSVVRAACFFHLRQTHRVRQSLDAESAATLVHAFVTSRVDYCNAVLAG